MSMRAVLRVHIFHRLLISLWKMRKQETMQSKVVWAAFLLQEKNMCAPLAF